MIEDKQKEYREKVLKQIEEKTQKSNKQSKKRYEENKDVREIKRLLKLHAFKKANPNKKLVSRLVYKNQEWIRQEVCQLEDDNIIIQEKKENKKKWDKINSWKDKMAKAGIKIKPRKYYKPPRDLSIHTHDKCRVPALTKRNGKSKW